MADLDYFPKNYSDAKKEFRRRIGTHAQYGQWSVPSKTETDLFVDHAYYPSAQPGGKLFLIFSGVHGGETYAGHAIQTMFLDEILPRLKRSDIGVFLAHSLNPYGFKHHQRCTENGVNLNRNCSASDRLYKIDNAPSLELSRRFIPRSPVDSLECQLLKMIRKEGERVWFDDISLDQFVKTAAQGQYASVEGFEFGGFGPEPQIQALIWRLREIMPGYRDVILLDLHTGLGDRARLHLLTGDPKACVNPELFAELFDPSQDRALYDYTAHEAEGFYPTFGATNDLVAELVQAQQRVCAITMEFGTLGHDLEALLKSLNQWMLEHQASCFGYRDDEIRAGVENLNLEKFYPSSPSWRESIVFIAREMMFKVFQRSGAIKSGSI